MKFLVFSLLIFVSFGVCAEEAFPKGCKAMPITGGTLMLPEGTPALIVIHNLSEMDLWVTHPISDSNGASAGWSTRLQADRWSAFAQGDKAFELSCIESKPGHEQQVPCSKVLAACQWAGIKTPDKQNAPFWAGENLPLKELLSHVEKRGFKLSASSK